MDLPAFPKRPRGGGETDRHLKDSRTRLRCLPPQPPGRHQSGLPSLVELDWRLPSGRRSRRKGHLCLRQLSCFPQVLSPVLGRHLPDPRSQKARQWRIDRNYSYLDWKAAHPSSFMSSLQQETQAHLWETGEGIPRQVLRFSKRICIFSGHR